MLVVIRGTTFLKFIAPFQSNEYGKVTYCSALSLWHMSFKKSQLSLLIILYVSIFYSHKGIIFIQKSVMFFLM